jgi:hypothetical protein
MYLAIFSQMKKQLGQVKGWLDAATAAAKGRSFDPELFLATRLSPDQFPFTRQLQSACDAAKLGASRISGKPAPAHADDEKTIAELRARIDSTVAYLDGFSEADFEGAATRSITTPRWEGKTMAGADFLIEHVVPNFYFHLAHVYALLRHAGVQVGKRDYLGQLSMRAP